MKTSLKDELDLEIKTSARHKYLTVAILSVCLLLTLTLVPIVYASYQLEKKQSSRDSIVTDNKNKGTDELTNDNVNEVEDIPASTSPSENSSQIVFPAQTTKPQKYEPSIVPLNKENFVADGNVVLDNYSHIVNLVSFSGNVSNIAKGESIKEATTVDNKSFSQVTDLRGHLVLAEINSGPYMDAVELAESGVSKISVGLVFMGYWVKDNSRTDDLNIGLASVGEGSKILLIFAQKLESL